MPEISVILGYRNRDTERVERCLDYFKAQTYKDFELIFVDYGSSEEYQNLIKPLVEKYNFTRYVFNNTLGMPWNRSHSLNTGARVANGEYLLFGDVDVLYYKNFLETLIQYKDEKLQIYNTMNLLPEGFSDWDNLENKPLNFTNHGTDAKGPAFFVKKEYFEQVGGFDEFYCFWGQEDEDLYQRLLKVGIRDLWLIKQTSPMYHQWHEIVSDQKKGFFPEKWWDDMNIYYSLNLHKVERNNCSWGNILTLENRKTLTSGKFATMDIPFGSSYIRGKVVRDVIEALLDINDDTVLRLNIPKIIPPQKSSKDLFLENCLNKINPLLKKYNFSEIEIKKQEISRERDFYPEVDMMYLLWYLIQKEKLVSDYCIEYNQENITVKLLRKSQNV